MDIQKEREAFEAWLKSLNENGRTTYFLGQESTVAWEAWQAATARMEIRINTLDEMLLNQGEALAQAKAKAVPEGFVIFPKKQTSKMRSLARDFDARLSLTKYEQLHNIWVKQAMLEAQEQKG